MSEPTVDAEMKAVLQTALVAMKLASAIPAVSAEYDFEPAIAEVVAVLSKPTDVVSHEAPIRGNQDSPADRLADHVIARIKRRIDERSPRHYDSQGYCDNPARGY